MQTKFRNCNANRYLEVIAIRLYNLDDQEKILKAFQQISNRSTALQCTLFENRTIRGAWSIHLWWSTSSQRPDKSPEAICISSLLREIGLVHHMVCTPTDALTSEAN